MTAESADVEVVRTAIVRWAQLYDLNRDAEWIEELLHDDVVLHEPGDLTIEGKDQVRRLLEQPWEGEIRGVHLLGLPTVSIDGDRATASTNSAYVMPAEDRTYHVYLAGRYDDELIRCPDGAWRFTRRTSTHLGPPPNLTSIAADRSAVADLVVRLFALLDDGASDHAAELFTSGALAITAMQVHAGASAHVVGHPLVTIAGDAADVRVSCLHIVADATAPTVAVHRFHATRSPVGWLISGTDDACG